MAFEVRQNFDGCTPGQLAVIGSDGRLNGCFATQAEADSQVSDLNAAAGFATPTQNAMGEYPWEGPIGFTGLDTGDGRLIDRSGLDLGDFPQPLFVQTSLAPEHQGAEIGGRIDHAEVLDDGTVWGRGVFENSDFGKLSAYRVGQQMLKGVSLDLRDVVPLLGDDGEPVKNPVVFAKSRMQGATVVGHPAFVKAQLRLTSDHDQHDQLPAIAASARPFFVDCQIRLVGDDSVALAAVGAITASAGGSRPRAWFQNPHLSGPTPLTVDGDHIYGHLAAWGTCHTGMPGCTPPPKGTDYSWFHQAPTETDDGIVRTGTYTLHANHASVRRGVSASSAVDHYAHSALGGADVVVGEDEHGIWMSGAIRPGLDPEMRAELLGSKPSGDWRPIRGHQELIGILAVNTPGFPIPQTVVASAEDGTLLRLQGATGGLYFDHDHEPIAASAGSCSCGGHAPLVASADDDRIAVLERRLSSLEGIITSALGDQVIETLTARIHAHA